MKTATANKNFIHLIQDTMIHLLKKVSNIKISEWDECPFKGETLCRTFLIDLY